jgi:methionyl-tRNA synthetase
VVPAATVDEAPEKDLKAAWATAREGAEKAFETFAFHKGLELVNEFVKKMNAYLELRAPWKLAKSAVPKDAARLATSLALVAEGVRLATAFLTPVMPQTSNKVHTAWGLPPVKLWLDELDWGTTLAGKKMESVGILFPKFDAEKK